MDHIIITWGMFVYGLVVIPSVSLKHHERSFAERTVSFSESDSPQYYEKSPSYQYLASRYVLVPDQYLQSIEALSDQPHSSLHRSSRSFRGSYGQSGRQNHRAPRFSNQGPQQFAGQRYGAQQFGAQQFGAQQFGAQQSGAQGYGSPRSQAPQKFQGNQPAKTAFKEPTNLKKVDVTPRIKDLVQRGLAVAHYDSKNVKVDLVKAGGRNMNFYRVRYTNPAWNQNCFFKFHVCTYCRTGFRTWKPVCSSPCPGGVCRVDRHLQNISSMDTHYEKDWSDTHFREVNNTRRRNYNTLDSSDNNFFNG